MPNNYKKEKNQLFQSLLSRAKKKGYIHAATIIERFQKYDISENEKDDIFEAFHNEGVEIIFESAENDSDPSDYLDTTSYEDALLYDGRDSCYADPLQIYIKEIHRYPTLSHKETLELVRRKDAGDSSAREYLINCNLKFAFSVAAKFVRTGVPLLDLIQQANIGLMKATDLFSPSRGTRFTTYAVFWIRQSIGKYVDEQSQFIRLPDHLGTDLTKIKIASENYYLEYMRYPTDTEIADRTGLTIAQVKRIRSFDYQFLSTDEKTDENMDGTLLDILSDEDEPHTVLHSAELRREISGFLNKLKERERFVIISRYGLNGAEPRSLEDVGRELGLSRERVRIIEMNALKKIRKMPNIDGLYEYLLH